MNPTEQRLTEIENLLKKHVLVDRYLFETLLQIADGRNIQLGRTNGTKLGTATDQLLAFYGNTPVDQPATVSDPTGGATVDSQARTSVIALIDRLQELGLIA